MPRLLGGFVSPSLRWWSPWWWPLVHLRSFRCRLLDGSHYTRLANVRQIETTQTPPKPLQTLVFVGVSQPHDGDTKTADTTATATPRDVTATSRRPCPGTPRHPGHDGHATARPQPRHGHDGHDGHGHDRIRGTCPRNTTRHAKTQSHKRSNVAPCNKHPRGGVSPRRKKQGRWLSSADAECSLEHFWITRYSRSLHIFSGCNRCCTLHIVYNVPWIDVDGGEASLSHINVWPSTHKGSVRILDAVRSAVRPVYPGRGLYGLVPIILGWSAILLAQPFGCRVRFPGFALGFMG